MIRVFTAALITLVAAFGMSHALARGQSPDAKKIAPRIVPFNGKLLAVDRDANTFTVGKRVFHVTPETKLMKDGKAAKLSDGVLGEKVGGSYVKLESGVLHATKVRFGEKAEADSIPDKDKAPEEAP